jgi:hypothetical protein
MTEAEWLTSDDATAMWLALPHPRSRRLASLFGVACVRVTPEILGRPFLRGAADVVELAADEGDWTAVDALNQQAGNRCHGVKRDSVEHYWELAALRLTDDGIDFYAMHVPLFMLKALDGSPSVLELRRSYADLLRDIAGKPTRTGRGRRMKRPTKPHPFPVLGDSHLTSDVIALARGSYEERAFDRMPILADALQDAGCDSDDILSHCRGPGPHARGCWVVDLILGKTWFAARRVALPQPRPSALRR